jgi:hypothetical protein
LLTSRVVRIVGKKLVQTPNCIAVNVLDGLGGVFVVVVRQKRRHDAWFDRNFALTKRQKKIQLALIEATRFRQHDRSHKNNIARLATQ